jgi:hypothetical protein
MIVVAEPLGAFAESSQPTRFDPDADDTTSSRRFWEKIGIFVCPVVKLSGAAVRIANSAGGCGQAGDHNGRTCEDFTMKIFKWVCINLVVLAAILYSLGVALPRQYYLERSILVNASPRTVFSHVDDLRGWPTWAAWTADSTAANVAFGQDDSGADANYTWKDAGGGGTIRRTGGNMGYGIGYTVEFQPSLEQSAGLLRFLPEGSGTKVVWTNEGIMGGGALAGYSGLFKEWTLGPDLEAGLANLKQQVEALPPEAPGGPGGGKGRGGRGGRGKGWAKGKSDAQEARPEEPPPPSDTPAGGDSSPPSESADTSQPSTERAPPADNAASPSPDPAAAPTDTLPKETASASDSNGVEKVEVVAPEGEAPPNP